MLILLNSTQEKMGGHCTRCLCCTHSCSFVSKEGKRCTEEIGAHEDTCELHKKALVHYVVRNNPLWRASPASTANTASSTASKKTDGNLFLASVLTEDYAATPSHHHHAHSSSTCHEGYHSENIHSTFESGHSSGFGGGGDHSSFDGGGHHGF